MATEGELPKTDGDILFASEVNSFIRNSAVNQLSTISNAGSWNIQVPDNLSNLTDGDLTSSTGIGIINSSGTNVAEMVMDLGSNIYHTSVGANYTVTAPVSSSSLQGFIDVSQDNLSYNRIGSLTAQGTDVEIDIVTNPSLTCSKFRYVKLGIKSAGIIAGSVTWQGHELTVF